MTDRERAATVSDRPFKDELLLAAAKGFGMGLGMGFVTVLVVIIAMALEKLP